MKHLSKKQLIKLIIEIPLLISLLLIVFFLGFYAGKARGTRLESYNSETALNLSKAREKDILEALLLTHANYTLERAVTEKVLEYLKSCKVSTLECMNKGLNESTEYRKRQVVNNDKLSVLLKQLGIKED